MKIKINKKQAINEITEQEYEFLEEALNIPPSELPFSNIFGNKYRVLGNFETLNEEHPLSKMIKYLEFNGWSLDPHTDKQPLKFTKSYRVIKPMASDRTEIDTTPATRTITLTLQKIIQNMVKAFENSLPKMAQQYEELTDQAVELNNKISKGTAKLEAPRNWSFLAEDEEEMDALIAARDKIKMKQVALGVKLRNTLSMYLRDKEATMPIRNIADKDSMMSRGIVKTVKEFKETISDEAQMYKWQESFSGLFKPAYVIFSRHPVDVFRMSDFTQIRSCHSPPSKKVAGGFDDYNICALAEAYANGMISYVVSAKEFEDNDIEPTQEGLDQYEDEELFYDEDRNVGFLEPRSRIRIRRGAYTNPDTGNVTPLAIPDQKIYGLDVGGFKEYVRDYIANIQKDSIEKIFPNLIAGMEDGDTIIDLENIERFGGSYEDSGAAVRQNLPLMFASALGLDPVKFVSSGYLKYDRSLQKELKSQTDEQMGQGLEQSQEEASNMAQNASMENRWHWEVEMDEDYDGIIFIEDIRLRVYALLPEDTDVANNFSAINEIFEDYKDKFSLPYGNDILEPDEIGAYAAGQDRVSGYNFTSPFVRIEYPNLQQIAYQNGEPFQLDALDQDLDSLDESSRDGGMSLRLATDPYVEDGFDVIATKLLAMRGFVDDSDFYLQQVVDAYAAEQYKEWEEISQDFDYIGGLEIQTEATFTSTLSIDLSVLQEKGGYTPRQAAALLIMLGEDETLQRFLINEINKECQIAAGDADSWNGMAIPFTITGPDNYSSVEEILEDDPDAEVDDSFDLRMELDQDDVRTKGEKKALAALLEQYDEAEMAELILAYSKPLKAKIQELFPAQPTNENKKRMKVRMLRG